MKEYLGKRVKMSITYRDNTLFFTATIIDVTDSHVTFIDKFEERYTFKIKYIEEISPA